MTPIKEKLHSGTEIAGQNPAFLWLNASTPNPFTDYRVT
jgi:hypothetical protein